MKGFPPFENKFGKMDNSSTSGMSNSAVRMTDKSNQNNSHPALECGKETSVSIRLSGKTAKRIVSINLNLSKFSACKNVAVSQNKSIYAGFSY